MIGRGNGGADPLWQLREAYRTVRDVQRILLKAQECLRKRDYGSAEGWVNSAELKAESALEHVGKAGEAVAEKNK